MGSAYQPKHNNFNFNKTFVYNSLLIATCFRYTFSILEDSGWNFRHAYYHELNRRTLIKVTWYTNYHSGWMLIDHHWATMLGIAKRGHQRSEQVAPTCNGKLSMLLPCLSDGAKGILPIKRMMKASSDSFTQPVPIPPSRGLLLAHEDKSHNRETPTGGLW